jgi:hypothetical protein
MRKGYNFEYFAKKRLEREFGKGNVLKIPFWSFTGDFFVLGKGKILKIVECKSSRSKYRPSKKEIKQLLKQIEWAKQHNIIWELWVKEGRKIRYLSQEDVLKEVLKNANNT